MMFLKLIILLISSVLYAQTSNTKLTFKPWQYTRKMNSESDDDNCICFPKGQLPSIHNILDSNNSGQERIVVYFYKNIGSNEIKMYTPSSEKQLLIPDLPYDSGDQLISVTTNTINTLFYNNPNRIKIYDNHFEKLDPGETVYWPIGLNHGAIEHVYPNVKDNYPPTDNTNVQNRYIYDGAPDGFTVYDPKGPNGVFNTEVAKEIWSPNDEIMPNENSQIPSFEIDQNNYKNQITFSFQPQSDTYSQSLKHIVTFDVWFNEQFKNFQHYNTYDLQSIDFNVLRNLVQQVLYKNNIRVGFDDILRDSNGVALEPSDLELRPLFIGQTIDHKLMQPNPPDNIILPNRLPYLEGILVTLVFPPRVLGLIPLGKTFLSKQSYQVQDINNSSTIFSNRYVDPKYVRHSANNGQLFNFQKLYSGAPRPGFLYFNIEKPDISYPYSKLNNYVTSNQYSSSSFSESLRPPGIFQQPYRSNYWELPQNELFSPPGSIRRKLSDVKIKHHIEPPKLQNKKQLLKVDIKSDPKQEIEKKEDSLIEPYKNVNASESARRFQMPSIQGVMKSLLNLLSESRRTEDNKLSSNSTEDVDIVNESKNINDGERPDYRIIGGNAATGSGTPLSNKGRSANIESDSE